MNIMFCFISSFSVPSFVKKQNGQTRPGSKAKMPLQTLHMTSENQKRVKELLRELQGQDLPELVFLKKKYSKNCCFPIEQISLHVSDLGY